jgi:hypothetical protein
MMELKKQQARAPKKQSPSAKQLLDQKLAITDGQIDQLVYELCGLSDDEIRVVEDADRAKLYGAVSRKPIALPDALVYELYGLTEEEIRTVEG